MSIPLPVTCHDGLCFSQANENLCSAFRLRTPSPSAPPPQMLNPTVPPTVGLLPHFLSGKAPTTQTPPPEGQQSQVFPGPGGPSTVHGCRCLPRPLTGLWYVSDSCSRPLSSELLCAADPSRIHAAQLRSWPPHPATLLVLRS